jgi:hypothetical protein
MSRITRLCIAALCLVSAECQSDRDPNTASITAPSAATSSTLVNSYPAPSGLATVSLASGDLTLWPYTSTGFSVTGEDPVNLIFTGAADPRQIRATLMTLSGSGRPGPLAAFNCTWSDAVGDPATQYSAADGWVGSAIQMQCGNFYGPRFHLRMYRQGNVTVANAHFEILIPGTNTHEVLSWELAEALVAADIARSGRLAAAPSATQVINSQPYFRAVQAPVVAFLPPAQIAGLGLSVNGDGTASIPNDGRATVLDLASSADIVPGETDSDFIIQFGQVIPKPFCTAGTTGYVYASGPIAIHMRSGIVGENFEETMTASGTLTLIEINPLTGQPASAPYQGIVGETTSVMMTPGSTTLDHFSSREETPDAGTNRGTRVERLQVRQNGRDSYSLDIKC